MEAAYPNEGKRVWKITLARTPTVRVGDPKRPSIHDYKTAAPVFRETMGEGDQQWRSMNWAFKYVGRDLVERLLAERIDQGFVRGKAS